MRLLVTSMVKREKNAASWRPLSFSCKTVLSLESESLTSVEVYSLMNGLQTKLQQRKKYAFFGAKVDRLFTSSIALNISFYDTAEQYLEKWFNFSETGHLYNIQYFNLKENQEINYLS